MKRETSDSDLQGDVKHGINTMEFTRSQSKLILRLQSRNSVLKLEDCTTMSIIRNRDISGFRFSIVAI